MVETHRPLPPAPISKLLSRKGVIPAGRREVLLLQMSKLRLGGLVAHAGSCS